MVAENKIIFIINKLYTGGAERQVVDDYNELGRRGLKPMLVTLRKETKDTLEAELLNKEDWEVIPFKGLFDIGAYMKLVSLLRKHKPVTLITHLWFANTIGRITGKIAGVERNITFEQNIYDSIKTKKQFLIDKILQIFSDKVIAVSEAVKKSLLKNGISEKRITVLHNSVDLKRFENVPREAVSNFRKEFNLENDFVITTIGRLNPQKNIELLIRSLVNIKDSKLLVVGDGELKEDLVNLALKLNISDRVIFTGVRNDIPVVLKASDCFVLTSYFEGLGIVILEALATGLPTVVTSFDVAYELIDSELNGIITGYSEIEIEYAVNNIMDNELFRNELGVNSKERSREFSVEAHNDKMLDIIYE
jgi:glycosyltransferase involved in cell wall biosynthesis